MSIVVPDSITPYEGYKYLRVGTHRKGELYSSHGNTRWAPGEPLEARCTCDFGWGFFMRPQELAIRIVSWKRELEEISSLSTESVEFVSTKATIEIIDQAGETQFLVTHGTFEGPPRTILPPSMAWSYEPRPCPHDPVAEDCTCGIYAVNTPKQADPYRQRHTSMALVRVALWGRVIIGDKGARGQYAYPVEVLSSSGVPASTIRECYGLTTPEAAPRSALSNLPDLPGVPPELSPEVMQPQSEWSWHWFPRGKRT